MSNIRYGFSRASDYEKIIPGFTKMWKEIKEDTHTRCRCPKSLWITDKAYSVCADDHDLVRRYALNLATMELSGGVHVSTGEWALANRGEENAVQDLPDGVAILTCRWNDFHRYFSMDLQVKPGSLPEALPEGHQHKW